MVWYVYLGWFLAGVFLTNAIPHIVQGICGNRFQTPFARPPAVGESSAEVNVLWGFCNLAIGIALLYIFLPQLPPPWTLCAAALVGGLVIALYLARHFGKVRTEAPHP
jgi:ABC-type cobalamin transport system permease subunit